MGHNQFYYGIGEDYRWDHGQNKRRHLIPTICNICDYPLKIVSFDKTMARHLLVWSYVGSTTTLPVIHYRGKKLGYWQYHCFYVLCLLQNWRSLYNFRMTVGTIIVQDLVTLKYCTEWCVWYWMTLGFCTIWSVRYCTTL